MWALFVNVVREPKVKCHVGGKYIRARGPLTGKTAADRFGRRFGARIRFTGRSAVTAVTTITRKRSSASRNTARFDVSAYPTATTAVGAETLTGRTATGATTFYLYAAVVGRYLSGRRRNVPCGRHGARARCSDNFGIGNVLRTARRRYYRPYIDIAFTDWRDSWPKISKTPRHRFVNKRRRT